MIGKYKVTLSFTTIKRLPAHVSQKRVGISTTHDAHIVEFSTYFFIFHLCTKFVLFLRVQCWVCETRTNIRSFANFRKRSGKFSK